MGKRERNWRPSLLSLQDVEYELRISATKFTEWMVQGWMPQPWIKQGGVTRWRTSDVLDAIENFPNRDELSDERERVSSTPWKKQKA